MNFSVSRININVKNASIVKDHILFLKQPENIKLLITWQLYAKNVRHKAPRDYQVNANNKNDTTSICSFFILQINDVFTNLISIIILDSEHL